MNKSSVLSLVIAFVLAGLAVVGMQSYLRSEKAEWLEGQQTEERPENTIVVAAQPLRFGKIIEPDNLKVIAWPSETIPEGAYRNIQDLISETGEPRYVMSAIETAEPILSAKITGPGQRATLSAALSPGMKAVSISVNDVLGVAGFVLPGDRVDVMLTRRFRKSGGSGEAVTNVLMQGVKVLAIDQIADDRTDNPSVAKTVTFEVSTEQAQKLTLAQSVGTLSLALRNVASSEIENVTPIDTSDLALSDVSNSLRDLKQPSADQSAEDAERERLALLRSRDANALTAIGVYRGAERVEYRVQEIDEEQPNGTEQ